MLPRTRIPIPQPRLRPIASALAVLLAAAPDAIAQERPEQERRDSTRQALAPVVVQGVSLPAVVGGAGAVAVTLDSLPLPAAPLLGEALGEIPFILVRRNSRGEMEVSVRGSESRQVAILLDGVPITLGWDHRSDVSLVPLTGASRISLVRGLSSLLHGPNVLGGVVEVSLTGGQPGGQAPSSLALASSVDQLGGHAFQAAGGGTVGNGFTLRGGAGYRDSPGAARIGGLAEPGTDADLRTNSDAREVDLFGSLGWQGLNGARLGVSATTYQAERGVPPELHLDSPRLWRVPDARRTLLSVSGRTATSATPFGHGSLEGSVGTSFGRTRIETFDSFAYDRVTAREAGEEQVLTARVAADHSLGANATLRAAATGAMIRYDETLDSDPTSRYEQRLWSVASEATWAPLARTQLSGGLALDGADTPESGDKPAIGALSAWGGRVGVSHAATGAVELHASLSRRVRFPALRELYSGALGRFDPNPELQPERLTALEAGATTTFGSLGVQGLVFHHRLGDGIVQVATEGRKRKRVNRDEIRSTGVEMLATWRHPVGVELLGDLMVQRVRVLDPSADASSRPENQPELTVGAQLGVPLPWSFKGVAGAHYMGAQYCVNAEQDSEVKLKGQLGTNLGVERGWSLGRAASALLTTLRTRLTLDNLGDAAFYYQCGLPQPGRTVRLTVSVS